MLSYGKIFIRKTKYFLHFFKNFQVNISPHNSKNTNMSDRNRKRGLIWNLLIIFTYCVFSFSFWKLYVKKIPWTHSKNKFQFSIFVLLLRKCCWSQLNIFILNLSKSFKNHHSFNNFLWRHHPFECCEKVVSYRRFFCFTLQWNIDNPHTFQFNTEPFFLSTIAHGNFFKFRGEWEVREKKTKENSIWNSENSKEKCQSYLGTLSRDPDFLYWKNTTALSLRLFCNHKIVNWSLVNSNTENLHFPTQKTIESIFFCPYNLHILMKNQKGLEVEWTTIINLHSIKQIPRKFSLEGMCACLASAKRCITGRAYTFFLTSDH